ncbi:MAG: DUF2783 domain-containing protein [Burkholderiales bacterium]|jgi:hypothetical protein
MLPLPDLESTYDQLAQAIDQAAEGSELFLVKLVLLQANAANDPAQFTELIAQALRDL